MKLSTKLFTMLATTALLLGLSSCGSIKKKETASEESTDSMTGFSDSALKDIALNSDSDSNKAGPLQSVFFGYDSSILSSAERAKLDGNADFLKANPSVEIQVEGHCDERGGVQYNLALGEKRAASIKQYLLTMGVKSSQVSIISFGKERPVAFGHDDSAWGSNRRGNFVITSK